MNKFLILIILCSCSVGKDYQKPDVKISEQWIGDKNISYDTLTLNWWKTFNDPILTDLINRSIESNLDLKQAVSRIRQARYSNIVSNSRFFPNLNLSTDYQKSDSENSATPELYQAGLDAFWEIDIFGGIRREVQAAKALILAEEENKNDILVTLTSEVGINYINLRGYQQELLITKLNLDNQKKFVELTKKLFVAGFTSKLDFVNAQAQASTTESQIPILEANIEKSIYQIGYLLGKEPESLKLELSSTNNIPSYPDNFSIGIPSELIRRRPDIRRAEANLKAATANIGVAVADLFPKFTISGGISFNGNTSKSLVSEENKFWSFNPGINLPIFNAGKLRANVKIKEEIEEQSLLEYEKTILNALKEVNSALIDFQREKVRWTSLNKAVDSNLQAVEIANKLYKVGQTDFLNVLSAQRALYISQSALVQSTKKIDTDLIQIFKSLGGI